MCIFWIVVADRLRSLCRGALNQAVPVDCHNARPGVASQTDVSDLAFRNAVDRLLATVPIPCARSEQMWSASTRQNVRRTVAIAAREITVVHARSGISHHDFPT